MSYQSHLALYSDYFPQKRASASEILQHVSFLTKLGALTLLCGKFFMFMAIAGIFVPALNAYAITCTIIWGSLVMTTIILCSVDHYLVQPRKRASREEETVGNAMDALMYSYAASTGFAGGIFPPRNPTPGSFFMPRLFPTPILDACHVAPFPTVKQAPGPQGTLIGAPGTGQS